MASGQALQGKRLTSFAVNPDILVIVGLDTDDGESHPLYDERILLPLSESLVQSINKYGNIQEVVVRKNSDGAPQVVYGRQRVRAMREVNKVLVAAGEQPKLIRVRHERGDDLLMVGKAVTENSARQNDTPMGKARKMQVMLDLGASDADCSIAFCVSVTAIRQWKKLLDLDPKVQEAVDKGTSGGGISSSAAMNLAGLDPKDQVAELEKQVADGGRLTFKQARRNRQNSGSNKKHHTAFVPPRKPVLKKVAVLVEKGDSAKLSTDAAAMLNWVLGKVDASSIKGLSEALAEIEKAKDSLTKPQIKILASVDAEDEKMIPVKGLNSKTVSALVDRGALEQFEHGDGMAYVRRPVDVAA